MYPQDRITNVFDAFRIVNNEFIIACYLCTRDEPGSVDESV